MTMIDIMFWSAVIIVLMTAIIGNFMTPKF